jgi:4-azaleucine resistance transporter AzlC
VDRRHEIVRGLRLSLPAGLGLFPLGVAFGMLVIQDGLEWWVAPALSISVYAGSVELLLASMIATATPLATVALTILLVNFRHVFYAFSFPRGVIVNRWARLYSTYALTDESFATAAAHPVGWTAPRLLAVQIAFQCYWVGGGLVGVAVASLLPRPIRGLEFALVALFLTLALDACRTREQVPSLVLAAGAFGVAAWAAPGNLIFVSMIVFVLALAVRFIASSSSTRTVPGRPRDAEARMGAGSGTIARAGGGVATAGGGATDGGAGREDER